MRDPRKDELKIKCVIPREAENTVAIVEAIVDKALWEEHNAEWPSEFIRQRFTQACMEWAKANEHARELIESQEYDFNIGDVVNIIAGGYDDALPGEPEPEDLELYLIRAGLKGIECDAHTTFDPEDKGWAFDDLLIDENGLSDS